jgi:hypothetical protein
LSDAETSALVETERNGLSAMLMLFASARFEPHASLTAFLQSLADFADQAAAGARRKRFD